MIPKITADKEIQQEKRNVSTLIVGPLRGAISPDDPEDRILAQPEPMTDFSMGRGVSVAACI
jgi:hypothetical protein